MGVAWGLHGIQSIAAVVLPPLVVPFKAWDLWPHLKLGTYLKLSISWSSAWNQASLGAMTNKSSGTSFARDLSWSWRPGLTLVLAPHCVVSGSMPATIKRQYGLLSTLT